MKCVIDKQLYEATLRVVLYFFFFNSMENQMKHKHNKLIKQWADNTSLIRLHRPVHQEDPWRKHTEQTFPRWFDDIEYFLVPEKHVEVALHWLNGGEVEMYADDGIWLSYERGEKPDFIPKFEYRIKPVFTPKAGNWYECNLRQTDCGRNGIFYCDYDGHIDLPYENSTHVWKQEDVTIIGTVEVTPI